MCFFFNDTATTEIYTLSLHDALPIFAQPARAGVGVLGEQRDDFALDVAGVDAGAGQDEAVPGLHDAGGAAAGHLAYGLDRKSTRLNSSHANISYAVFCL